ncbi:hypothetical protein [Nevskia ramosa]|uniref:hypothetical protein n=1 Tax=Nevskia ramosa TaxID=64002 RepID=UPI002352ED89|nr:hypothetical protein [Nevskia ramosa]
MTKPTSATPSVQTRKPLAEAAMRRAADRAKEAARRFGTPLHYLLDGHLVSETVEPPSKP